MTGYLPHERWMFASVRREPDRFTGNAMLLMAFAITVVGTLISFHVILPAGGYEWLATGKLNGPMLGLIWSGMLLRNLSSLPSDERRLARERLMAAALLVGFSALPFVLDRVFDWSEAEFGSIMNLITPMIILGLLFYAVARAPSSPSTYSRPE